MKIIFQKFGGLAPPKLAGGKPHDSNPRPPAFAASVLTARPRGPHGRERTTPRLILKHLQSISPQRHQARYHLALGYAFLRNYSPDYSTGPILNKTYFKRTYFQRSCKRTYFQTKYQKCHSAEMGVA